jgi:hypothetical protein
LNKFPSKLRSILLIAAALAPFSFISSSRALTVAIEDNFFDISTGDGNWSAALGHKGGTGVGTFDISTKRPAVGATSTGTYDINFNPIDGEGHGSTATFQIGYSVTSISIPGRVGNYWNWTLNAIPKVMPKCEGNSTTCRNIAAALHIDIDGLVFEPDPSDILFGGKWVEQTVVDNKTSSGLECIPLSQNGDGYCTEVPGPLPILGIFASLGFSRKIRMRIKSSKSEAIRPI